MKQITKSKIFYWAFTAVIAIPLLACTLVGTSHAYYDIGAWKFSRRFVNKFWYGRTIARRRKSGFYWAEARWLIEQRARATKTFHKGYELVIKL